LIDRIAPELLRGELHYSARGSERRAVLSCPGLEARLFFSLSGVHKVRLFAAQGSRGTLVFDDMHHHPLALHEDAVELFSDQRFDERALRSKLGFGTPLDVSPGMPLDAALSDFVSCAARAKASGSATSESSHMQSVVGALERGCPFPGPLGAGVPLEVPA
jgi:hypothetical protein